jgi:hypothetical protein
MKLKITQATKEDIYRDTVRIPEQYRVDANGKIVPEGSVCKICIADKSTYAIVRGLGDTTDPFVRMDERLRNSLNLKKGEEVEIRIRPSGFWGQFQWSWNASDPAYRVAARMGLLSVALGLLGLLLGLLSLRACK